MIEPKSSFPVFTVRNLEKAETFYTRNLGFETVFSNDWYLHLVSKSGIQVGFMLPGQPTQPPFFQKQYNGAGVIFSLEVDDADSAFAQARSLKLNIVLDLRAEDWGQYHFCIEDPNGIHVDIVQAIEPTDEYLGKYVS